MPHIAQLKLVLSTMI